MHVSQADPQKSGWRPTAASHPRQITKRWRRDLNPRTVLAVSRFQGECIRPLCHATADKRSGAQGRRTGDPLPTGQTRPILAEVPPPFKAALIRRQFSPIAAICGLESGPRKFSRTPLA